MTTSMKTARKRRTRPDDAVILRSEAISVKRTAETIRRDPI